MFWKRREPDFYQRESARIQEKLEKTEIGTEEYQKLTEELIKLQAFIGKEKERKQIFTKEGKGTIIGKLLGIVGLGIIAFSTIKFEKDGHVFTGNSQNVIKSVLNISSKMTS